MNQLCQQCGGKCCKTLLLPVNAIDGQWLCATRGASVKGGVLIDSPCRHLDSDGKCAIYDARPYQCRQYQPGGEACNATREAVGEGKGGLRGGKG